MSNARPRLALATFGALALVACSAQQQPIQSAPSTEPATPPPGDVAQAPVGAPRVAEPFPGSNDAAVPHGSRVAPSHESEGFDAEDAPHPAAPPPSMDPAARGEAAPPPEDGEERGRAAKAAGSAGSSAYRRPTPQFQPGLATQWGEARHSQVSSAPFRRADASQPFALGKLFYNDRRGLDAMLAGRPTTSRSAFPVGSGFVEVGVRGEDGRFITGYATGSDAFVPGYAGQRYSIVVKNQSPGRLEIVASVDGLDVVDGRPASFAKRGYLVDPYGEVEIDGFRTSTSEVASFRFGSVGQSYAAKKHGDTRNVGVIGIAAFHEEGDTPWRWTSRLPDADRRLDADPFPMRFASPPR